MDNSWSVSQIQQNMAKRLQRDAQLDKSIEFLSLIQNLVSDKFGRIPKEAILFEAKHIGYSEDEVYAMLDVLIKNGSLREQDEYVLF